MISGFSVLFIGGKVGRAETVGEIFTFGSEARERGSAVNLGRKIMPATRTIRTTSMGKRLLRIFSLLLAGFTSLTMADLQLIGKRGII